MISDIYFIVMNETLARSLRYALIDFITSSFSHFSLNDLINKKKETRKSIKYIELLFMTLSHDKCLFNQETHRNDKFNFPGSFFFAAHM